MAHFMGIGQWHLSSPRSFIAQFILKRRSLQCQDMPYIYTYIYVYCIDRCIYQSILLYIITFTELFQKYRVMRDQRNDRNTLYYFNSKNLRYQLMMFN